MKLTLSRNPLSLAALVLAVSSLALTAMAEDKRPNVLLILADDLGYSDIGAFGSEISTPNLDALAATGRVLTNVHVTPLCATTRAELLTGVDHHLVGVGTLSEARALYPTADNYRGHLTTAAPTIAKLLQDAGYHTYHSGKWHLGSGGPSNFGFERSFSLAPNAADGSHYANTKARPETNSKDHFEDGNQIQVPDDFYSSDYYTDKLIQYIDSHRGDGKPFFGYLAFQAVHFPLQVPEQWITPYRGRYDVGYDAIRDGRLAKQKALGLFAEDFTPNPGDEGVPMIRYGQPGVLINAPWNNLSAADKRSEARVMEVFAGMVTNMDANIGRLLNHLKDIGEYDNTFIIFLSDNGADGHGQGVPLIDKAEGIKGRADNSLDNYGLPGSYIYRSTRWAEVGAAPFRLFKGYSAEGGTSSPTLVHLPYDGKAATSDALASVLDIAPTILDLAGVAPDTEALKTSKAPLEGQSLLPVLRGTASAIHDDQEVFAGEVNDNRYVRRGPWKLTRFTLSAMPSTSYWLDTGWHLYNVDADRGETQDLTQGHPEIVADLLDQWNRYVDRVGVALPILDPIHK